MLCFTFQENKRHLVICSHSTPSIFLSVEN